MKQKGRLSYVTLLLICLTASSGDAAAPDFRTERIGADLFLIAGPAGNTLVARDADGLVLVDGVPADQARSYLEFVAAATGTDRVKTLVNTHWHADVTGLNDVLGRDGVEIVAHVNTRQWLGATIRERGDLILHRPMPAHAMPTSTFHTIHEQPFRDGRIVYGYLPQAHTDGDIYVFFPERNLLYTGGMLRTDGWTTIDLATNGFLGTLLDAWEHLLGEVVDEDTLIVPATGPMIRQAEFADIHADHRAVMGELVVLLRKSWGPDEVVAADPAQGLRPEWGNSVEFLDLSFRSFHGHLRESEYVGAMP